MIIGTLQLELHFPKPQSLKEKRMILKSLVTRMRKRFNVSVAELDGMDLWQSSLVVVVAVGGEKKFVDQTLNYVADFVRAERETEMTNQRIEIF
ncbi:MAG: DUF503 domain-containing protein [Candidatus Omnitrophica bacterium]|nr:DUF503 domain-containing protein [Candidatus Omnitrophota bacterium]